MKFKFVKILGVKFDTKSITTSEMVKISQDPNAIGVCDTLNDKIFVLDNLSTKAEVRTFIHEWSHGVKSVAGIDQVVDPQIAEVICQSYANAIIELLEQRNVMTFINKARQ